MLCAKDYYSGQDDYDHRRQWVVDRLASLVDIFAIDLCAYAVMSNHYHVVLKVDRVRAENWTQREVAEHWMMLFAAHHEGQVSHFPRKALTAGFTVDRPQPKYSPIWDRE